MDILDPGKVRSTGYNSVIRFAMQCQRVSEDLPVVSLNFDSLQNSNHSSVCDGWYRNFLQQQLGAPNPRSITISNARVSHIEPSLFRVLVDRLLKSTPYLYRVVGINILNNYAYHNPDYRRPYSRASYHNLFRPLDDGEAIASLSGIGILIRSVPREKVRKLERYLRKLGYLARKGGLYIRIPGLRVTPETEGPDTVQIAAHFLSDRLHPDFQYNDPQNITSDSSFPAKQRAEESTILSTMASLELLKYFQDIAQVLNTLVRFSIDV